MQRRYIPAMWWVAFDLATLESQIRANGIRVIEAQAGREIVRKGRAGSGPGPNPLSEQMLDQLRRAERDAADGQPANGRTKCQDHQAVERRNDMFVHGGHSSPTGRLAGVCQL